MEAQATTKNLKRTLEDIQSAVDDIKTSMTDQQYNELCKKLKTAHELVPATTEYKLSILHFEVAMLGEATFEVKARNTSHR